MVTTKRIHSFAKDGDDNVNDDECDNDNDEKLIMMMNMMMTMTHNTFIVGSFGKREQKKAKPVLLFDVSPPSSSSLLFCHDNSQNEVF